MNKDRVCCVCLENKKFLGRINGGKNYYCTKCTTKINKSGIKYWKDCSFVEFLESMSDEKTPRPYSETPMADGLRRAFTELGVDIGKSSKNTQKKTRER